METIFGELKIGEIFIFLNKYTYEWSDLICRKVNVFRSAQCDRYNYIYSEYGRTISFGYFADSRQVKRVQLC